MKTNRKKIWIMFAITCLALGIALYFNFFSGQPKSHQITITTATPGGTFNELGIALAGSIEQLPGAPIEHSKAVSSDGSVENIRRLTNPDSDANIGFAAGAALIQEEAQKEIHILSRLYKDVLQIVVRRDSHIENIDGIREFILENNNQKIFVGPAGSSTRIFAERILETIGLADENYTIDEDSSNFTEAAEKLENGKLKVAFFMSGIPTPAVQTALESDSCMLLPVSTEIRSSLMQNHPELALIPDPEDISANTYRNQLDSTQTIAAWVYLICRRDIKEDLAELILSALFDNIAKLLNNHAKAQDIKLASAFDDLPDGFSLHPGAARFRDRERDALLIATGTLNGKYYQLGEIIQWLLEERGIDARVIHTDGSLENLNLLHSAPTIAILQYDAALAAGSGKPMSVYNVDMPPDTIPQLGDIRRIAVFHEEKIHVVADGEKLTELEKKLEWEKKAIRSLDRLAEALQELPREQFRICLGPPNSASQVVARAILKHHGIDIQSSYIKQSLLSVSSMVNRLQYGETDLGFFTSYVPSEAMKTVLNDERFRLLSLGAKERSMMVGEIFVASTIDRNTYPSQYNNEPVQTLATKAVLVTTKNLPRDVGIITKAIFEGAAYLGLAEEDMAKRLPSLPLHMDAERYYREAGIIPSEARFDWLRATWTVLGCLVMTISGYKGLLMLRRSRTGNRVARKILAIPLEADFRVSAQKLMKIRDEIQERVRSRWWVWGEIDKHRWRYLADLIQKRIDEAKENLTRSFVAEIRSLANSSSLSEPERMQRRRSIENRILEYFERGELDSSQQKILRELLHDCGRKGTATTSSGKPI